MTKKNAYESILAGLNEAINDAKSPKPYLKRNKVTIRPLKTYNSDEIKSIRNSVGMSQGCFASYMGVSEKTVEAWEAGTNHPSGSASRILQMMEMDKDFVKKYPFVSSV